MLNRKSSKLAVTLFFMIIAGVAFTIPAFAAGTDVAGTVENAYNQYMQPQVKQIVNNVVLRCLDIGLGVGVIVRLSLSGYSYKHNGNQFEWHLLAILGGGLIICLSAPYWIWNIIPGAGAAGASA